MNIHVYKYMYSYIYSNSYMIYPDRPVISSSLWLIAPGEFRRGREVVHLLELVHHAMDVLSL